jgi:LacI family transcriptional regulator
MQTRAPKRVTLKELAKAAGVSVASASYAINGTGSVGDSTREHILKIAAELDYRPNQLAKAMKTGRTGAIGLVVPDLTNPFFPNLAQTVIQTARRNGFSVFITNTEGSPDQERRAVSLLVERGVDGLVWFPIVDTDTLGPLVEGTPTVVLDRNLAGYDLIQADYALGGELAAEHLIRAGHRKIGVISGPLAAWSARQRAEAAIGHIRVHADLAWSVESAFSLDLETAVTALLDQGAATAVVAGADLIAIGAIRHLQSKGVNVPGDVSIIGFDDIPWAQLNSPALTTIEMPVEEMAAEAVETLLRRIASPKDPRRRIVFNVALIERATVGPVRGPRE